MFMGQGLSVRRQEVFLLRRRIGRFIGLEKGCNGVLGWKYERQLQVIRKYQNI